MQYIQGSEPQANIDEFRHAIDAALERGELAPVDTPLTHYHTADLYGRRIVVPAHSVFTTRVHKTDHIAIALRGRITIVNKDKTLTEVTAPDVLITRAGTQRIVYVHEECEWVTVHHCTEQDDDKVADALGFLTMQEYNDYKLLESPL